MTTKERLKLFIQTQNLSILEFEKSIKVSNGYVNSITKSIQPDKLSLIVDKYPLINIYWLLLGKGDMLLPSGEHQEPAAVPHEPVGEQPACKSGDKSSMLVADETQGYYPTSPTEQVLRQLVSALERTIKDKEEIISLLKDRQPKTP